MIVYLFRLFVFIILYVSGCVFIGCCLYRREIGREERFFFVRVSGESRVDRF